MKTINLLLKNAFRSARKNVYQIVGLSVLIFLVSVMFSLLSFSGSTILNGKDNLNAQSNLRDALVEIHTNKMFIKGESPDSEMYDLDSTTQQIYQEYVVNEVANQNNLNWTRTEGRTFSGIKNGKEDLLIKTVTKFGNEANDYSSPTQLSSTVDKLVITDGANFSSDTATANHQTVLQKNFAEKNGIKIGDVVRFNADTYSNNDYNTQLVVTRDSKIKDNLAQELKGKSWSEGYADTEYSNAFWFEVVGFGISADFAAPIIDQTTTIPNIQKDLIAYVPPSTMGYDSYANSTLTESEWKPLVTFNFADANLSVVSENDQEIYFSLKSKDDTPIDLKTIKNDFQKISGIKTKIDFIYNNDDSNYIYNQRISLFSSVTSAFNALLTILLLVIVAIAIFVIVLITKKYVESISQQLGCLKALGYKKREIVNNFIALPIISSAIGCLAGYLISIGVCKFMLVEFNLYFNINFDKISFNVWSFLSSVYASMFLMILLSYSSAYIIIRHSSLRLLQGDAVSQSSKFSRGLKKLNTAKSFDGRLRGALISSSFGKITALTLTVFLSTLLMTASVMAPKIMDDNTKKSFDGLNYQNEVDYNQPLWNNPLSFFRTFNPNFDGTSKGTGNNSNSSYGFYDDKVSLNDYVTDNSGTKNNSESPLPYTSSSKTSADAVLDTNRVMEDVIAGNISNYFYSMDKPTSDKLGTTWSRLAYLGWTTLPMSYLKALNNVEVFDIFGTVMSSMSPQWPEYQSILDNAKLIGSGETTSEGINESKIKLFTLFKNFYVKLSSGLPLLYSTSSDKDNFSSVFDDLKDKIISSEIYNNLKSNAKSNSYYNDLIVTNDVSGTSSNFIYKYGDESSIDLSKTNVASISSEERDALTIQLLKWFYGCVYQKMGTILLETSFYRSPYFVQQNMTKAFKNNTDYSLSFNITPYDSTKDDIGTMVDSYFSQKNGVQNSLKIYGVKENQRTIDLGSNISKLFDNQTTGDETPIIVNNTVIKKTGLKIGDTIDIDCIKNELQDSNGNSAILLDKDEASTLNNANESDGLYRTSSGKLGTYVGISPNENPVKGFLPESASTVYGLSYKSYANSTGILGDNLTSGYVAGSKIAGSSALDSTSIHDATINVADGKVKSVSKNINKKFKIVGIQSSYGKPLAFINNDEANKILGYDVSQKYLYSNFFYQQYANFITTDTSGIFDGFKMYKSITYHEVDDYDTLDKLNTAVENAVPGAEVVLKLFNNLYPVFNYKMSIDSDNSDLDRIIGVDNLYGDFSSVGLNGGYTKETDNDPKTYYSGFGSSTVSLIYPINQAREILEQITSIVDMLIIMLLVIAFIVSITIIILTTSIIIRENKQFISTMKVLGYSDRYIIKQIVSIYIFGIIFAFVCSFILAWFGVLGLSNILAQTSSWVLPVIFYYWYPFATLGILALIYGFSVLVGWRGIQRINPIDALKM